VNRRRFFAVLAAAITGRKASLALPKAPSRYSNLVQPGSDLTREALQQALAEFAVMKELGLKSRTLWIMHPDGSFGPGQLLYPGKVIAIPDPLYNPGP
jgi:hypothetical protein